MADLGDLVVKVSLDGVDFQRGLDGINRAMKMASSEFAATSSRLKSSGTEIDLLRAKADYLTQRIQMQEARVRALNSAYQESIQKNGQNATATQNLATRLNYAIAAQAKMQNELKQVNTQILQQTTLSGRLGAEWQKAMNDAQQSMGNAFDRMRSAGMAITGVGAGLAGAFGVAVKAAGDFESSMNTFGAVSGATGDQMQRVRDLAVALGNDMTLPGTSAKDAADAMTELAKSGLSVQQSMDAAKGTLQLAAAAQVDNAQAATIVGQALNAFGLQGSEATHVADLLANSANASAGEITDMAYALQAGGAVAKMAGQSIDDTVTAISLMANAGIVGSDAGTSLKSMFMALINPTKQAQQALQEYGIQVYDAQGKMLQLPQIVEQFSTKLKNLTPEQRNAALATIFGSDAVRAASIVLTQGTEAYDKMRQAVERHGGAQEVAASKMQGFNGALEGFKNALQTLAINAGSVLLPAVTNIVNGLSKLVNIFTSLPQGVQTGIVVFGAIAAAVMLVVGPLLMLVGMIPMIVVGFSILGSVIAAIAAPVGIAVAAIAALVAIGIAVYTHWDQIKTFLAQTWQAISDTAQTVWGAITGFFSSVWNGVVDTAKAAWDAITSGVQQAWQTITGMFQTAWNLIAPIVTAGWTNIQTIFSAAWETIKSVVSAAWEIIKTIFATAFLAVYYIVTGQWDKIGQVFQAAWNKIKDIVSKLWDDVKKIWSDAWDKVKLVTSGAWKYVQDLFSQAWDRLKKMVTDSWNNIKQAFTSSADAVRNTVSNMWNSIVDFFRQAPSRISSALQNLWDMIRNGFRDLATSAVNWGGDLVRGFVDGIWNLAGWARNRITGFFGNAEQWAKNVLGIKSPSRVFAEIGQNVSAGLAVGIDDGAVAAVRAISSMVDRVKSAAVANVPVGVSANAPAARPVAAASAVGSIVIQQMVVRSDDDIRRIARELYWLQQSRGRAGGWAT